MNVRVLLPLTGLTLAAALAFSAASAQPMGGGGMSGDGMSGGGMGGGDMKGEEMMKGCDMMGGGMMGGGMMGGNPEHMSHMMSMMHEKLSHAGERVAALKTELKITEAQMPAWTKFSDVLLAAAKSMDESMQAMHKKMESGKTASLPEKLEHRAKMAGAHSATFEEIKTALDPLYASFSDEQKKIADGLKIGPMGVM